VDKVKSLLARTQFSDEPVTSLAGLHFNIQKITHALNDIQVSHFSFMASHDISKYKIALVLTKKIKENQYIFKNMFKTILLWTGRLHLSRHSNKRNISII
jgi:hypothetical protein